MFRTRFNGPFIVIGALLLLAAGAFAQTAPIRGVVKTMKADGTKVPVEGALVEPYRIDIDSGKSPSAKTDKDGNFSFAGFPVSNKYVLSISASGMYPSITRSLAPGTENLEILMQTGDSKVLNEAEVRAAAKQAPNGGAIAPEADAKKQQADFEAKKKVVEDKNKKIQESTEIINAALKAGNEAFNASNYELAIAKYAEGIAADPEYVGSVPVLTKNKGAAHTRVAVDSYNASVKMTDAAEKAAAQAKSKKNFVDAAESYLAGWNVLKNAPAADITDPVRYEAAKLETTSGAVETFRLAVFTDKIDDRLLEIAKILVPEYLNLEKNPEKRTQANLTIGDLYRVKEDRESAIAAYRKVLESSPDSVDAMAYLGIVLVDMGWLKDNDKALTQEGANYLQQFVAKAPDTHKLKTGAVEYLEILKTQNVVPDKKAAPTRKKP